MRQEDIEALRLDEEERSLGAEIARLQSNIVLGWALLTLGFGAAAFSGQRMWLATYFIVVGVVALLAFGFYTAHAVQRMRQLRPKHWALVLKRMDRATRKSE